MTTIAFFAAMEKSRIASPVTPPPMKTTRETISPVSHSSKVKQGSVTPVRSPRIKNPDERVSYVSPDTIKTPAFLAAMEEGRISGPVTPSPMKKTRETISPVSHSSKVEKNSVPPVRSPLIKKTDDRISYVSPDTINTPTFLAAMENSRISGPVTPPPMTKTRETISPVSHSSTVDKRSATSVVTSPRMKKTRDSISPVPGEIVTDGLATGEAGGETSDYIATPAVRNPLARTLPQEIEVIPPGTAGKGAPLRNLRDISMTVGDLHNTVRYAYNSVSGHLEVTRARLPHQLASASSGRHTIYTSYRALKKIRVIGQSTYGHGWLVVGGGNDTLPIATHITAVAVDGMPIAPPMYAKTGEEIIGSMQLSDFKGSVLLSELLDDLEYHSGDELTITASGKVVHAMMRKAVVGLRVVSAKGQQMRGLHIIAGVPGNQYMDTDRKSHAEEGLLRRFDILHSVTLTHDGKQTNIELTDKLLKKAISSKVAAGAIPVRILLKHVLAATDLSFDKSSMGSVALEFTSGRQKGNSEVDLVVGDVIVRVNQILLQPHEAGKLQLDAWVASSTPIGEDTSDWENERITLQVATKGVPSGGNGGILGARSVQSEENLSANKLERSVNRWCLAHYDLFPDTGAKARVRLRAGDTHQKRQGSNTGTRGAGVAAIRRAHGSALLVVCVSKLQELLPQTGPDKGIFLPRDVRVLMDKVIGGSSENRMEEILYANVLMSVLLSGVLTLDNVRLRPIDVIRRQTICADGDCGPRTSVYKLILTQLLNNLRGLKDTRLVRRLRMLEYIPVFVERYESGVHAEGEGVRQGVPVTLLSGVRFVTDGGNLTVENIEEDAIFAGLLQTDSELFIPPAKSGQYTHRDFASATSDPPRNDDLLLIVQSGFRSHSGAHALLAKNRIVWNDVLYDAVLRILSASEGEHIADGSLLKQVEAWRGTLHSAGLRVQEGGKLGYHRTTRTRDKDSAGTGFVWNIAPMYDIQVSGDNAGTRKPLVVTVVRDGSIRSTLDQLYCCQRPNSLIRQSTPQRGEGIAVGMGINKLEGYVHSKYWGISRRKIAHFLNNKEERQICRALRIPSTLRHLPPVYRMNDKWQIDSAKMGSTHRWWPTFRNTTNDGHHLSPYRGYVAAIDVFTRFAWIHPIATKASSENDSIACFEKALGWCKETYLSGGSHTAEPLFRTLGGVAFRPKVIQSDNGAEFGLAGGKIRTVVDGQMINSWIFDEYNTKDRQGTLSRFQRVLQDNMVVRYDTVRPAAPQQQAYIEVFNKTFKKIMRDMILAGGVHHRILRRNPGKQLELMMGACAKYNDSPHSSMPPHLTPHKLALCMMTEGVAGAAPWKTAQEVVAFRKAHYIGHAEKKRKGSVDTIDVGAFVRVALGEGRDYFDNDSTWQEQRSARENYTDRQAQKNGLRKALGSNYSTQLYRVVGRRAPHPMSALHYYIAPVTMADLTQFGRTTLPPIAPGEHIMKRHIGFYAEHLLLVDMVNLEPMFKCSLRGVEGENYGAEGTECNPSFIAQETKEEDALEHSDHDNESGGEDGISSGPRTRSKSSASARRVQLANSRRPQTRSQSTRKSFPPSDPRRTRRQSTPTPPEERRPSRSSRQKQPVNPPSVRPVSPRRSKRLSQPMQSSPIASPRGPQPEERRRTRSSRQQQSVKPPSARPVSPRQSTPPPQPTQSSPIASPRGPQPEERRRTRSQTVSARQI
jgi:hypothetical protein